MLYEKLYTSFLRFFAGKRRILGEFLYTLTLKMLIFSQKLLKIAQNFFPRDLFLADLIIWQIFCDTHFGILECEKGV